MLFVWLHFPLFVCFGNSFSAVIGDFGVFLRRGEHTSFYSTTCPHFPILDFSQDLLFKRKTNGKNQNFHSSPPGVMIQIMVYPSRRRKYCGMRTCFIYNQASTFHCFCTILPTAPCRFH